MGMNPSYYETDSKGRMHPKNVEGKLNPYGDMYDAGRMKGSKYGLYASKHNALLRAEGAKTSVLGTQGSRIPSNPLLGKKKALG